MILVWTRCICCSLCLCSFYFTGEFPMLMIKCWVSGTICVYYAVGLMNFTHVFACVLFCCGLILVGLSHILQGYTSLSLGQSYDCPCDSEVTLKDVGEGVTWIHWEQQSRSTAKFCAYFGRCSKHFFLILAPLSYQTHCCLLCKLGRHWFSLWFVICHHCLNQCWQIFSNKITNVHDSWDVVCETDDNHC